MAPFWAYANSDYLLNIQEAFLYSFTKFEQNPSFRAML